MIISRHRYVLSILTMLVSPLILLGSAARSTPKLPTPRLQDERVKPALDGNRGPYEVAFTPDGSRAIVTEFDEGAVAIIDRASGEVLHHIPTGGTQPTGVAVTPDGSHAIVTNSFSGSVCFVDLKTQKTSVLPLRGAPWDVVISNDGARAYVSVSQLDHVAVVDIAKRTVIGTIPTGYRPRALAITPDGATVVAGNMTAGSVSFLDTATMKERAQGPTPAVNVRGVAVFPNGRQVVIASQRAQNERPTETPIGIWSNQLFVQVPDGPRNGIQNLWLDLMGEDVSDPDSVVLDSSLQRAYVTCSGGHSVNVVPLRGNSETVTVKNVGAVPHGLAFTPDRKELWVANTLSNDLAVIDPVSLKVVRRVNLGKTARRDASLLGRYLFNTATITKGEQFSCASCHPDGGTDGIAWKFVHVPDALGKENDRNVKGLQGEISKWPPYRWTGHEPTIEQFVKDELAGLLQGSTTPAEMKALADYVGSLPLPPNPYRAANGSLTAAAQAGKALFDGRGGCASCHSSATRKKAWIGTSPEGVQLLAPRLEGVYDTAPYLHTGKANTLEEVFSKQDAKKLHGKASELSEGEMKQLLEYVREL